MCRHTYPRRVLKQDTSCVVSAIKETGDACSDDLCKLGSGFVVDFDNEAYYPLTGIADRE